jgi:FkbM family methyltransferase
VPNISYSQNGEDILINRYFGDRIGSFLDIGGYHPVIENNTYLFYRKGWRGTNIEPVPQLHQAFVHTRPEDRNLHVAILEKPGVLPFYTVLHESGQNAAQQVPLGLTSSMWDRLHVSGLSTFDAELADRHRLAGYIVQERTVQAITLPQLVQMDGVAAPDFVSLDVEGFEDAVIRQFPFDHWQPELFVIESTAPNSTIPTHQSWEPILLDHGYLLATFNGVNRFYLRGDKAAALEIFKLPVSAQDNYRRADVVDLERRLKLLEDRLARIQAICAEES